MSRPVRRSNWAQPLAVLVPVALVALGGLAQAQDLGGARASTRPNIEPVTLTFPGAGGAFGRQPKLRSTVQGWALTGSRVGAYEVRCDDIFTDCAIPILRTRTQARQPLGLGSLTHTESAAPWRGRRVELRAELRSGRIEGWAGLWIRLDDADGRVLAFDNMQDRALRGTSSFEWYSVVLDVPATAVHLSFGVLLHGPGAVFIRQLSFEAVDTTLPVTDLVAPLRARSPASGQ
jgi:hypothetical protein